MKSVTCWRSEEFSQRLASTAIPNTHLYQEAEKSTVEDWRICAQKSKGRHWRPESGMAGLQCWKPQNQCQEPRENTQENQKKDRLPSLRILAKGQKRIPAGDKDQSYFQESNSHLQGPSSWARDLAPWHKPLPSKYKIVSSILGTTKKRP